MMKKCPFCGADIENSARFCMYCMHSLTEKEQILPHQKKKPQRLIIIATIVALMALPVVLISRQIAPGNSPPADKSSVTEPAHTPAAAVIENYIASSCTETGSYDKVVYCSVCNAEILRESKTLAPTGHNVGIDKAKAPTCTKTGLTVGKHCSVCSQVLVSQEMVGVIDHTVVIDKAKAPTCNKTGLTEGKHCSVCSQVLVAQETINVIDHTVVIDEAKAPTCNKTGLTEGKHCSVCSEVLVAQETVSVLDHTVVIDEAIAPTCTKTGLTEGKHCSVCSAVIVVQKPVNTKTHSFIVKNINNNRLAAAANCKSGAQYYYSCVFCGARGTNTFTVGGPTEKHNMDASGYCTLCDKPIGTTEGVIYDLSSDGTYAEVIGYEGKSTRVIIADTYKGVPVKSLFGNVFKNSNITSIIIPDSVTTIGNRVFYGCTSLTSVTIPDGVTSIGSGAFYGCTSLTSVTIPDGVIIIDSETFKGCTKLSSVTIPDSVTLIGADSFYACTSLKSIIIPDSVTIIAHGALSACNPSLYTVYENGKYIGDAKNPYRILIELTNNKLSTYKINENTEFIASGVFQYCERLSNIVIPDSVTNISSWTFSHCTSLKSVTIGKGVESICKGMFNECKSLTSLTIPNHVTSIDSSAFKGCTNLTSVTIPEKVTSIGDEAFYGCTSLTSIKYMGTKAKWNTITKGLIWDANTGSYTVTYGYADE